jgi:hypothetical protein
MKVAHKAVCKDCMARSEAYSAIVLFLVLLTFRARALWLLLNWLCW